MKLAVILMVIVVAAVNAGKCGHRGSLAGTLPVTGNTNYIVGGGEARPNEFPWQISFQAYTTETRGEPKRWIHKCGGSILNDRWIVTAAHCHDLDDLKKYRIIVGAHNLRKREATTQTLSIEKMIIHDGFDDDSYQDDIAMVKVVGRIQLNSRTAVPVCLPTSAGNTFENSTCLASGWGKTSHGGVHSDTLLRVNLPVVPNSICQSLYDDVAGAEITKSKICAGNLVRDGEGVCKGDSGGPFVCLHNGEFELAGITSSGFVCGSKDYPVIFTRVSEYRNWIETIIREN